jgi:hypothetical protein
MMNTVKHTFHSIGDRGGDFARTIGSDTAVLARRVGSGTASLAKRIGPRRGLIALAVVAAAIGGSIVVARILRARKRDGRVVMPGDEEFDMPPTSPRPGTRVQPPMAGTH